MKAAGADLVEFGAGEPDFPTPADIKEAAIAAIQGDCTSYTAIAGMQELRQGTSRAGKPSSLESMYHPGEVIVSTGGKQALFEFALGADEPRRRGYRAGPLLGYFHRRHRLCRRQIRAAGNGESENFGLTPEMIKRDITPRTLAMIINWPNNPSGSVRTRSEFKAIGAAGARARHYLISDECYST